MATFSTSHVCHNWRISHFSTSVMWRHLKFLHIWRNFQFPYNCHMTNIRHVCSFTMWRGGAQVIKEVRGCGGAKWTDFPTTILGFFYQRWCKRGHHKILPRITILSVVILNIPILRNIRAVPNDLKRHSHHSAQAKVKCLIIMWIVGMDHYLAMRKKCFDQFNKVERK